MFEYTSLEQRHVTHGDSKLIYRAGHSQILPRFLRGEEKVLGHPKAAVSVTFGRMNQREGEYRLL